MNIFNICKINFQGTSRYVYDIGNGLIKKIPKDKCDIWQNESEIRIYNTNKDNDLILSLEKYDKNAEWVIQRKCNPLSVDTAYLFKEWIDYHLSIVPKYIHYTL